MGTQDAVATYEVYEKIRDAKGKSDFQIATDAGLYPSLLSDWKAGRSNPKFDKVSRIAVALGVPVMELYGR